MRKLALLLCILANFAIVQAQNSEKELIQNTEKAVKKINDTIEGEGWKAKGTVSLLLNQSSFNNWIAGGEDSFSGTLGINYDFNYKKDDVTWDNKILASYGLLQTKNTDFGKKTDDRLEFNSIVGKRAFGEWYYSFFLNFRTQFTTGYIYGQDANGKEIRTEQTKFMSPGYLTTGPGIYWTKDDNLKINFAPLTSKFTFVDNAYTSGIDRFTGLPYVDGDYFGVDEGKTMRYELGFYASVYYKLAIMTNVTAENTLNLYSNYLEDPQNVDINYSLNIIMKINKFLSANLAFQAIYDDNAFEGLQTREVFGLGVNFGF
ncbi:DUF3078 domain-containing protein [Flavobacterium sp. S87F.05.LMB.W.Kidney.N]|uniref:DUF3078 domain-containing protein n=1 Tax=Flavobacterium sp. S87F.05.LMB.W.Kidney.N TaxID=1278758 RepID=UPI001064E6EA|nr:DUF3078 domain-containing protein [Flavobacterium sp. S87F.05.LMB.W.Kidney.N]TDX13641.1 DUF3078 family protein [Flavobacterium sp. S87F.05.LMB.W.Kidney.N]